VFRPNALGGRFELENERDQRQRRDGAAGGERRRPDAIGGRI
jgi:hypothetical protein